MAEINIKEIVKNAIEKNLPQGMKNIKSKTAVLYLLEYILEEIMKLKRKQYLKDAPKDKGNGYYSRSLGTSLGKLSLEVPRTREENFRPSILPEKYKRADASLFNLLYALIYNGYSKEKIVNTLRHLGLSYPEESMREIVDELQEKVEDFKNRTLSSAYLFVFIDGYHLQVKDKTKVRRAILYIVLGIDLEGKKEVLGWYLSFGGEKKSEWLKAFNDLINRGLKRVLLFICDDFSGISDAIRSVFPNSWIQKCYSHLKRNVRRNVSPQAYQEIAQILNRIKNSPDFEAGREEFQKVFEKYSSQYPHFIKHILTQQDEYLSFLKFPPEVRKHIYTTNFAESINSSLEKVRINQHGYFHSVENLELNVYLVLNELSKKWSKPHPIIKHKLYELRQMFLLNFELLETEDQKGGDVYYAYV